MKGTLVLLLLTGAALGAVSISAPGAQSLTHSGADAPQAFPRQAWSLTSSEALGATVTLSGGQFVHASNSALKGNTKLDLVVLSSQGTAGWTAIVPTDQTVLPLHPTASVTARSTLSGNGSVGLTVTFQESDYSILGTGNYNLTITGTIQGN